MPRRLFEPRRLFREIRYSYFIIHVCKIQILSLCNTTDKLIIFSHSLITVSARNEISTDNMIGYSTVRIILENSDMNISHLKFLDSIFRLMAEIKSPFGIPS